MTITVRLFAVLRTQAGTDTVTLDVDPGSQAAAVKAALTERFPKIADWLAYSRLAVNCHYAPWDISLHDGDEVALIPPVSGG